MSKDDSIEEEIRDMIKRAKKISLAQDEAKELMRFWAVMQLQKPQLVSKLAPYVPDAENVVEKICGLIGGIAVARNGGAITACADELLFRKRQSKPRKPKICEPDAFDEFLQKYFRKKAADARATETWRQLVRSIQCSDGKSMWVDGDAICIFRNGRKERRISKKSFPTILSKAKKKFLTVTGCG